MVATLMITLFNTLAVACAVGLAALYKFGVDYSLFWIYPWYDVALHLLGGFVLGLWAGAVALRLGLSLRVGLFFFFGVIMAAGVAWEIFEQVLNLAGDGLDTLSDLLFGAGGALTAFFFFAVARRFKKEV